MANNNSAITAKVTNLAEEVFRNHSDHLTRSDVKAWLLEIMTKSGDADAWDEQKFTELFLEIDRDGSGSVTRDEFEIFVRRIADL